jgi:hypothetical protein
MKKWWFTFLLFPLGLLAQVKMSTTVSDKQIGLEDMVTVRYMIEGGDEITDISVPNFVGWRIVNGPIINEYETINNGVQKKEKGVSYVLQPIHAGKIKVPGIIALVDGSKYQSSSAEINVLKQAHVASASGGSSILDPFNFGNDPFLNPEPAPKPVMRELVLLKNETALDKIKNNLFVRVETDKKTVYEGEPLIATYKLYNRLDMSSKVVKQPSFSGATAIDLIDPNGGNQEIETLNGKNYVVNFIRKVALYPLNAGELILESVDVENQIRFLRAENMNDAANNMGNIETVTHTLHNDPVKIIVKPIPTDGKPANFNGAVGQFSIESQVSQASIPLGEPMKLAVRISGSGNLQTLAAPIINWGANAEAYETNATDNFDKFAVPANGAKNFIYSFSFSREGPQTIPAITFSYFDLQTKKYDSVTTKPITVTVTPALQKAETKIEVTEESNDFFNNNKWWLIGLAGLIGISLLWRLASGNKKDNAMADTKVFAANEKRTTFETVEKIEPAYVDPLQKTKTALYDAGANEFYGQLQKDVWQFLQTKFALASYETNKMSLRLALTQRNISTDTIDELNQLLVESELALYAPTASAENKVEHLQVAERLIKTLEGIV